MIESYLNKNKVTPAGHDIYGKLQNGGNIMDTLALILAIVGCVNWGLVGLFQFDLVAWLFGGQGAVFSRVIYTVVALAGLWCITLLFRKGQRIEGE